MQALLLLILLAPGAAAVRVAPPARPVNVGAGGVLFPAMSARAAAVLNHAARPGVAAPLLAELYAQTLPGGELSATAPARLTPVLAALEADAGIAPEDLLADPRELSGTQRAALREAFAAARLKARADVRELAVELTRRAGDESDERAWLDSVAGLRRLWRDHREDLSVSHRTLVRWRLARVKRRLSAEQNARITRAVAVGMAALGRSSDPGGAAAPVGGEFMPLAAKLARWTPPDAAAADGVPAPAAAARGAWPLRTARAVRAELAAMRADLRRPRSWADARALWREMTAKYRWKLAAAGAPLALITAMLSYVGIRFGWKALLVVFFYYLVRDTLLYIVLPYLIYRGVVRGKHKKKS